MAVHALRRSGPQWLLDAHEREDVVSEVLLRVFEKRALALRRADPHVPMRAWTLTLVRNVSSELVRRKRRSLGRLRAVPERTDEDQRGSGIPVGFADARLRAMTKRQRAAMLACLSGLSLTQVAKRLGISWPAARELIGCGLKRGLARGSLGHDDPETP